MKLLAIDTALDACQAAILEGGRTLAILSEPMHRGHQERLAPLVREVLAAAGIKARELDRIAATVGPGSFTGLRVGLAFAKGLALAVRRPLIGVGSLEALAASAPRGRTVAAIDARRGQVWLQLFEDGRPVSEPLAELAGDALARVAAYAPHGLVGSAAELLSAAAPDAQRLPRIAPDPLAVARLAAAAAAPAAPPRPLYLRAPDARLPA